jgi:hypothetical protein
MKKPSANSMISILREERILTHQMKCFPFQSIVNPVIIDKLVH